jgi:hypothetical protein
MNVSGLISQDVPTFSSVLLNILVEDGLDSLPLTTLSLDVTSSQQFVNGERVATTSSIRRVPVPSSSSSLGSRLVLKNVRGLVGEDPFADYSTLNYLVSATSFDPQFSAMYGLDLLSNITQSSVENKVLDDSLSVELNKTVIVLSFLSFRNKISVVYDSPSPTSSPSSSTPGDVVRSSGGTSFSTSSNAMYIYIAAGLILLLLLFICLSSFRSHMMKNLEKKYNSSRNVTVYDEDDEYNDGDNPRFHNDIEDHFEDVDDSTVGGASFFDEPHRMPRHAHSIDYESPEEDTEPEILGAARISEAESNSVRRMSMELDERVIPDYERLVMPALRQKITARRASLESQESSAGQPSILSELHAVSSFGGDDDDPICRLEDIEINPNLSTTFNPQDEDEDTVDNEEEEYQPEGTHFIQGYSDNDGDDEDDDGSKSDADGAITSFSPNNAVTL